MNTWWTSLTPALQVLWAVTLSATLIFVIQSIMTFLGASGDSDFDGGPNSDMPDSSMGHDAAFDSDPSMNLLTFRNFINFCLGFGWTAVLLYDKISPKWLLFVLATLVGVLLVVAVMYIFKFLSSMQQTGTINVRASAVGCEGKVYLTIPGERAGAGKIQITINNSVREFDAVTDGDTLKTGTPIRVTEVINESTLLVEGSTPTII